MASTRSNRATDPWLGRLLAATALVSAWLLFQVQPMVAKRILPWFGGGTAVWTTAMLFFQAALFLGYLYAHVTSRRLSPERQFALHGGLLAGAVIMVLISGVIPGDLWKPPDSGQPQLRILATLGACVGLPFLLLATTAPLVQVWFARAYPGASPYRLYALSNAGSLAALVSYPLVIEPSWGVSRQGAWWSALFVAFAGLCAASGFFTLRRNRRALSAAAPTAGGAADARGRIAQYFFWLALPACASVVMLAVTAHVCQDVASIPLLWIAPMTMYLLTFILCFDSDRWYRRWVWLPAMAAFSYAACYAWHYFETVSFAWQLGIDLGLIFSVCMVCHGELAHMRPTTDRLTAYYLCISAGGALGGALTAIVAPLVFADHYELPLSIGAAWLLAIGVLATDPASEFYDGRAFKRLAAIVAMFLALAVGMGWYVAVKRQYAIALGRNFYGVLKVRELAFEDPNIHYYKLTNGRISHGAQFRAPEKRRIAAQYYPPHSGIGQILLNTLGGRTRRVGIAGLGAGTLSTYAESGDVFRFYEINPQDIAFANRYFTYLADARERGVTVDIVEGDARLALEREDPQQYDLLILDAFTSDSVPAHLLTVEALEMYLRHLKQPDGILAVHISNMHLDFSRVMKAAARRLDLDAQLIESPPDESPIGSVAVWIMLSRRDSRLAKNPIGDPLEDLTRGTPAVVWTDDYNNIVDILK